MIALHTVLLTIGMIALIFAVILLIGFWALDWRRLTNALSGLLTLAIALWGFGLLIREASFVLNMPGTLIPGTFPTVLPSILAANLSVGLFDIGALVADLGFAIGCVALYVFTVTVSGGRNSLLLWLTLPGTLMLIAYRALLVYASNGQLPITTGGRVVNSEPIWIFIYTLLAGATLIIGWRRRRKLPSIFLRAGIYGLAIGVLVELISGVLGGYGNGFPIAALGLLLMNYAQVRQQVILPLARRDDQLRGFRDVGVAISSRLRLDEVLKTIAAQSATMLGAESAAIFLRSDKTLELAAVYRLPESLIGHRLGLTDGLSGHTALIEHTSQLEDYRRDWHGTPDLPNMARSFGAVIAVPLIFDANVLGVLFVAESPYGKRFGQADTQLLELIAPQAAIAIANSRLFEKQRELDQLKNQMIRMTSHDLKNPLFAAMQRVELLQDEGADVLTAQMQTDLQVIEAQLERMHRIIRGILDIERASSGTMAAELIDAPTLVRQAITEFAGQAATATITLFDDSPVQHSTDPLWIYGDRHYLRQAIFNLIDNALKFTPAGGRIAVGLVADVDQVVFHVADSGVGIAAEMQPHVFERFFRALQPTADPTQVTGSGLGLSLVQAVVEAHEGRVWLESTIGVGTTIYIRLPTQVRTSSSRGVLSAG